MFDVASQISGWLAVESRNRENPIIENSHVLVRCTTSWPTHICPASEIHKQTGGPSMAFREEADVRVLPF